MVSLEAILDRLDDALTRFLYQIHPPLKKERDLLLAKVQDYRQRLTEAERVAAHAVIDNARLKRQIESDRRPETPKIVRAATSGEVRRLMEQAGSKEEDS